jgi:biotin carboxyl carrier protein
MRQIAKWTFLCVICTAFGFGATYLVAHSDRVIQTVAAMLPAHTTVKPTLTELAIKKDALEVAPADTASDFTAAKSDTPKAELGLQVAQASALAQPPLSTNMTSVGTLAAVPGQPGADLLQTGPSTGPLTAVGVVTVVRDRQVVMEAGGPVNKVNIEVGDNVKAGDTLLALDTTQLDSAVQQAEIGLESARIDFEEAGKAVKDADVAVAQANLLAAQESLALVQAGPTAEQLAAAEASAAAAWG